MVTKLDPLISEFETQEQADSYDKWFRAKVQEGIDDPRPTVSHEDAMKRIKQVIDNAASSNLTGPETVGELTDKLDPLLSEFETQAQADSYDRWFRAKVQASLDDKRPGVPHDQVMAKLDAIIDAAIARQKAV